MPIERKQREEVQHRIAIIDADRCKPTKCNYECMKICPRNRVGVQCVTIKEVVKADASKYKLADIEEALCIGCGACTKVCPFDAINIVNLPHALTRQITHQYGPNSFRVHRMPIPKSGQILGLLGSNGTGKSTLLNILGGSFRPNFGNLDHQASDKEILSYFRGSEIQGYLTRLYSGKLETVCKIQSIELISRAIPAKVTVQEWIDRRNTLELERLKEALQLLDLKGLLDREIQHLSGGELQRFAILDTCIRKAGAYLFDEPSAYLDIRQRLQAARLIQSISGDYRIVIEHDLALLDYLSDYICLIWGEPAAFGAIALPSPTGDAINQFLKGFIQSENRRIRTEELTFRICDDDIEEVKRHVCCSYPDFEIKYGESFSLSVTRGDISNSEIIVLLGENGTGKTSLIKALADDPSVATSEKIDLGLSISHKPQIIKASFQGTVQELLEKRIGSNLAHSQFQIDIVKPLGIEKLYDLKVTELSGGEKQRVGIVLCLGKPANIYLLDEPSAFLDCEQRVAVAKALKRFIMNTGRTAFVVEHDFMMASYLADKVIVYSGTPGQKAVASSPQPAHEGINSFLKSLDVTFRRDPENGRPRVNKSLSQKDREQKAQDRYY